VRSKLLRRTESDATHVQVNRALRDEFARVIANAAWDVCLLQEAPPHWDAALTRAAGASSYVALTSRNSFGPVRARLAQCNPDLMGSWEGGANITLVRPPWRFAGTPRSLLLNPFPERGLRERRRMSFTQLHGPGMKLSVANLHLTAGRRESAAREALRAAAAATAWSGATALVMGGDFNVRPRTSNVFDVLQREYGLAAPTAPQSIDHILVRGLEIVRKPRPWEAERRELQVPWEGEIRRLRLSDHPPVESTFGVR
jgi:endonuclease/exonuclease/phosphatase family metal-dependent hydrolase